MTLIELMNNDIADAVSEKLASIAGEEKTAASRRKSTKRKFRFDADYFADKAAGAATTAFIASIMNDVRTKPIEFAKERLYSAVGSAASRIMRI